MSLGKIAFKATNWTIVYNFIKFLIDFSLIIIFTQNLGIKQYGYFLGASLLINVLSGITNLGIPQYVIKDKNLNKKKFYTALTISLLMAFFITILINFIAYFLNYTNKYEVLIPYIQIMSIGIVPMQISLVLRSFLAKNLQNKKITTAYLIAEITSFLVIIFSLINTFSIYTPIFYTISKNWFLLILLLIFFDKGLKIKFYKRYIRDIIQFGTKYSINRFFTVLNNSASKIFCSFYLGPYYLGIIGITKKITNIQENIGNPLMATLIQPIIAKVNKEYPKRVGEILIKIKFINILILFPIYSIIMSFGDYLVTYFFPEKWHVIDNFIFISCLVGISSVLKYSLPNTSIILGKINLNTNISILKFFIGLVFYISFSRFGLNYLLSIELILNLLSFTIFYKFINEEIKDGLNKNISIVRNVLICNLIFLILTLATSFILINNKNLFTITVCSLVNICIYISLIYNLEKKLFKDIKKNLIESFN